jgi:hypothetical protein
LRLRPQQIVSQLLDTLNRAALNALSLDEAIERQIRTWVGEAERPRHLAEAAKRPFTPSASAAWQTKRPAGPVAGAVEVFDTRFLDHPEFGRYFSERYRHLIVDNVEEQTPAGQNFVSKPAAHSAIGGHCL